MTDPGSGESPNAGVEHVPDDHSEKLKESYRAELRKQRPSKERREELRRQHCHHLVRRTTSQYSVTEDLNGPVEMKKTAEVPDLYCFTCGEWVGLSGVDLRGTPRSRKDAYYLRGPPEEVAEARKTVRNTLADLAAHVAENVPRIEDAESALDFVEGEHEKARERVREVKNVE